MRKTACPRIFISAGEHSGDAFGAGLARELKRLAPDARLSGLGGARMEEAGVRLVADTTRHAGMGLVYVLRHAGDWMRVYRRAIADFNRERPDVVVPIDNPGFNLGKAKFTGVCGLAKDRGVPVCYYVSPQVWAWWSSRIHRIARLVDRMMPILPFEKKLYDDVGVDCRYVGHPLLDYLSARRLDARFLRSLADKGAPLVALFPGSRTQEIRHAFTIICAAARRIQERLPEARFEVGAAAAEHVSAIRGILEANGLKAAIHLGRTQELMRAARLCLIVSGTATLETAFYRTPMVIVYRTSSWHRHVVPWFLNVKHIGLVNIVGGGDMTPEFLKYDDDARPVADAALRLLTDEDAWTACKERLDGVMNLLGPPGSSTRAAEAVLELVGR